MHVCVCVCVTPVPKNSSDELAFAYRLHSQGTPYCMFAACDVQATDWICNKCYITLTLWAVSQGKHTVGQQGDGVCHRVMNAGLEVMEIKIMSVVYSLHRCKCLCTHMHHLWYIQHRRILLGIQFGSKSNFNRSQRNCVFARAKIKKKIKTCSKTTKSACKGMKLS